ncbi:hypothetical protein [Campylobacter phage CJLB-12]|nr:hypothetical protein [Campylobacter phage CJLB-12]
MIFTRSVVLNLVRLYFRSKFNTKCKLLSLINV